MVIYYFYKGIIYKITDDKLVEIVLDIGDIIVSPIQKYAND